jgi:uncharacterized repeat protein (TIGR01451 family)
MITKIIQTITVISVLFASFLFAHPVFADSCVTQYGGYSSTCPPTDLSINKMVKNPTTGVFVENLGITDAAFGPGSYITYKLVITNGSNETFSDVTIQDTLPQYLSFYAGPGTYENTNRVLTIKQYNLNPGESRSLEFVAQVESSANLPNTSFFCVTNKANVTASNRSDEDMAESCIQKNITGKTQLPSAGFEDLLVMVPFAMVGLSGVGLSILNKKK